MKQHGPTPWFQSAAFIYDSDQVHVATMNYADRDVTQANATLLTRSVNAHEDLLAAAQHVFDMIEVELYESPPDDQWHIAAKKLQAAIALAKDGA